MGDVAQFVPRDGVIDLAWGHPRPSLLPVGEWASAYAEAVQRYGPDMLTYGRGPGPLPLIEWLCERLGRTDTRAPHPDEVFVTAGASQGIETVAGMLLRPGDRVLVDSPTYHLALRILADHRVTLVPVSAADPSTVERSGGRLLYVVPTFGNPTGASVPDEGRRALVEAARRTGTVILEDDTYRELSYDGPPPASLWSLAPDVVVRVGSFSKTVAPGLRLGFLTATPALVARLADRGYVDSGGGVNHATALAMASFGASGGYERHLAAIRQAYRRQRDALVAAVTEHLPAARFSTPGGGWFLWLELPSTVDLNAAGVSYLDGSLFGPLGTDRHVRLSYSMLEPDVLAEGARRLGAAVAAHSARMA